MLTLNVSFVRVFFHGSSLQAQARHCLKGPEFGPGPLKGQAWNLGVGVIVLVVVLVVLVVVVVVGR